MPAANEQLDACKLYMRVDGTEEDALIEALHCAAQEYLRGAGIHRTGDNYRRYDLAVNGLTLYYYDHRDAVGAEACLPVGMRPIITQLKLEAEAFRSADQYEGLNE